MSRNKLYSERLDICILPDQKQALIKESRKQKITINELIRDIIDCHYWIERKSK